jgi:hypothetical protein
VGWIKIDASRTATKCISPPETGGKSFRERLLKAENKHGTGVNPVPEKFPAPVYAETVLTPNFEDAKRFFLASLLQMHYAHTLMLEKQGIISREDARACLQALDSLDLEHLKAARYDGSCEDLFFFIEEKLSAAIGVDLAGRIQRRNHHACLHAHAASAALYVCALPDGGR